MEPFYKIAVPHNDILEGRHAPDVFAAKLGQVFKGKGALEYKNSAQFFKNTHETLGLTRLLSNVEARLKGGESDSVIQIQTPFGGGKTHAQIAMYHKASKWDARRVVIDGAAIDAEKETLWGMLEKQLTGKIDRFNRETSPGRDALCELLSKQRKPVLILIDELLEYVTKAAGVEVGDSTRAAQTVAFMQELTEAAGILEKVALVLTLPSSAMEHFDESAERLYRQLQKVSGRVKKIYTPVMDHEIAQVIRHRLFSKVDETQASNTINEFMAYAKKESILPPGTEPSDYQKRFEVSYPFLPETIDVLYQQWGSLPTFQRTRGVLRLLALVIYSLKETAIPYIRLADFNLNIQDIRQELLEHIGMPYDSVLSADITRDDAGAKKVDQEYGDSYKELRLGTLTATTIFMYSFPEGVENRGATFGEIKRSATTLPYPSSAVIEASNKLKRKLFFLQDEGERVYFTTQANLNSILHTKIENLDEAEINAFEEKLLHENGFGEKLKTFVWPKDGSKIPDDASLKLVILKSSDDLSMMDHILETKGCTPRAYRNTLFFLAPLKREHSAFYQHLKEFLAYKAIYSDQKRMSELLRSQQQEVRKAKETAEKGLNDALRRYYRTVFIPAEKGFNERELSIPAAGLNIQLSDVVYDHLHAEGDILENLQPIVIKEMYLNTTSYVLTEQLYNSSATTRGALRVSSSSAWELGIRHGVELGHFGLGQLNEGEPIHQYFKKKPLDISLSGDEVIIHADICMEQRKKIKRPNEHGEGNPNLSTEIEGSENVENGETENSIQPDEGTAQNVLNEVPLKFILPQDKKVSDLLGMMAFLQSKFDTLHIELLATNGKMSEQEYEDNIGETVVQMGIKLE